MLLTQKHQGYVFSPKNNHFNRWGTKCSCYTRPIPFSNRRLREISLLKKYVPDPNHVVKYEPLQVRQDFTYEELPLCIVDRKEQVLRHRTIPYVKV